MGKSSWRIWGGMRGLVAFTRLSSRRARASRKGMAISLDTGGTKGKLKGLVRNVQRRMSAVQFPKGGLYTHFWSSLYVLFRSVGRGGDFTNVHRFVLRTIQRLGNRVASWKQGANILSLWTESAFRDYHRFVPAFTFLQ